MISTLGLKIKQIPLQRLALFLLILTLFSSCAAARKAKLREKQINEVIATARTFTGTPYKYGGMTRSGMDCSGLTINAYRSINLSLPREAADQATVGEKVKKRKDLREGDLVFFATGKKRRRVTHVGIVTSVKARDDIRFIHASTSLGVVETNLFSEYYDKRYRGARRIID